MLGYNQNLKKFSRDLRSNLTDSEKKLWSRIRRKKVCGVQFYRQKPIGNYIVDFYAPVAKLVIELDGSQHLDPEIVAADKLRDGYLKSQGLTVLRFTSREVLLELETVMQIIFRTIEAKLEK